MKMAFPSTTASVLHMDPEDWLSYLDRKWVALTTIGACILMWVSRVESVVLAVKNAWRVLVKAATIPFQLRDRMDAQDAQLKQINERVARVYKEVLPNGGSSMRDDLNAMFLKIENLEWFKRRTMDKSEVAMYECNAIDGHCTWVNESLCKIYGMKAEDMLGTGWLRAIQPPERQAVCWEHFQRCLKSDIPYSWVYAIENQVTGEVAEYKTQAVVNRSHSGTPLNVQGTVERLKQPLSNASESPAVPQT